MREGKHITKYVTYPINFVWLTFAFVWINGTICPLKRIKKNLKKKKKKKNPSKVS